MTVVYKVLRRSRDDGKLYSCSRGAWVLEYKPGVMVKPRRGSFLYAFRGLEDALRFAKTYRHLRGEEDTLEVWEAEGEIVDVYTRYSMYDDEKSLREFWRFVRSYLEYISKVVKKPCYIDDCPYGTVWCKWLKLKRRVV
jgi:hypothetical protein